MSLETVDENEGVDMIVKRFTYTKCANGDVIVSFFGEIAIAGVEGGPFTVRIPKGERLELEMIL